MRFATATESASLPNSLVVFGEQIERPAEDGASAASGTLLAESGAIAAAVGYRAYLGELLLRT